jgi:hypothetical protein
MEIVILSAAGIIAATIAYFQYKIGIRASEKSRLPPELMSFMSEFSDRNNIKTPPEPVQGLVSRIEELELRMERLHKDALRYLQQGSTRHKRAEQMLEAAGEEAEDAIPPQASIDFPTVTDEQPVENDLAWAAQELKKRGEVPVI